MITIINITIINIIIMLTTYYQPLFIINPLAWSSPFVALVARLRSACALEKFQASLWAAVEAHRNGVHQGGSEALGVTPPKLIK